MQSKRERGQEELFIPSSLGALIPDDHILKRVDRVLDLSWLHEEVRARYCQDNGRPSIDPESALRLMLAGFFYRIVHDRALLREAQVNIAIRWFAGYRIDEPLPERSSLTRIRQRWGDALFRRVFERTVEQCMRAGLVNSHTLHIDATLIRADVSWDSLKREHVERVLQENREDNETADDTEQRPGRGRRRTKEPKQKKVSATDPDATMATSCKQYHLEPCYKQHTAVEDSHGIVVDVYVTTGEHNEGKHLLEQVGRVRQMLQSDVGSITCDTAYAHARNYQALEALGIDPVIPPQRPAVGIKEQRIPGRRFKYDAHKERLWCPAGKELHRRGRSTTDNGYWYRARHRDCKTCPLRSRCISANAAVRQVLIVDGYPALLRARRRKEKGWDKETQERYARHRWRVEGVHGTVKTQHGLGRATRRGIVNVRIQAYCTAAVMNLKGLAKALTFAVTSRWSVCTNFYKQFPAHLRSVIANWRLNAHPRRESDVSTHQKQFGGFLTSPTAEPLKNFSSIAS